MSAVGVVAVKFFGLTAGKLIGAAAAPGAWDWAASPFDEPEPDPACDVLFVPVNGSGVLVAGGTACATGGTVCAAAVSAAAAHQAAIPNITFFNPQLLADVSANYF